MSLSDDKQAGVIDSLNTTSRYLDDILNKTIYFDKMVRIIYPAELQLDNVAFLFNCTPTGHISDSMTVLK